MSDPVNLSSTSEELHAAVVLQHTEKLSSLQEKYDQLESAYETLGDEAEAREDSYTQLSSTPELKKQNQEKLGQMRKQIDQMNSELDSIYEESETCRAEIEQTKKTLRDLQLSPEKSFKLQNEEDLGIDFDALKQTSDRAEHVLNVTQKKFRDQWDGWENPEQMLDGHVNGNKRVLQGWKDDFAKLENKEKNLLERRDKLGSNVLKRVWNWREISKIDDRIKNAPDWRTGYGNAIKNSEKDIVQAERARERFHKKVAQMKEDKAEEALSKAQKSEVALKGEEDLGIDFKELSKIGKQSDGLMNQMKGEDQLRELTGQLERLKKGQATMENAFHHVDKSWEDLKNQQKELSTNPISRYRNKEKLKEIGEELDLVVPQWYALQDGKIKYQQEIAKTEQAIAVCEKQIEVAKLTPELQQQEQQQPPHRQTVGEITHLSHGTHGGHVQQENVKPKVDGLPGAKPEHHSVGQDTHLGLHGHGDKNGLEVGVSKNPFRQGRVTPQ